MLGRYRRRRLLQYTRRGISQISATTADLFARSFLKKLEKFVNKRLVNFLEKITFFSKRQYGFRVNKSTGNAVELMTKLVSSDVNRACLCVFLDLAKAFDTVSITILLRKLELLGVRGKALYWFKNYLMDRSQCVKIDQDISNCKEMDFEVPQGPILVPTL